jgi:hypothetical protein
LRAAAARWYAARATTHGLLQSILREAEMTRGSTRTVWSSSIRTWSLIVAGISLSNLCWPGTDARGSTLYGSVNENGSTGNQLIYTVNQQTGAATPLGASGLSGPIDLASDWRSSSFRIFAIDATTNALYRINPATGAATLVGAFAPQIASLAFDVNSGKLYGTSRSDTQLYQVDPATAATTLVGPVGFEDVLGLGFDLNGQLFGTATGVQELVRINTTTGAATAVGPTIAALVDLAARPEDGVMFVVSSQTDSIYRMDTSTGQTTLVGPYDQGLQFMNGLAFSPAVPEPASLAVLVPAAATMTAFARRRKLT